MSTSTTTSRQRIGLNGRRYAWLAVIPLAALIIAGTYWGLRERAIAQDIRQKFSQWEAAGIPFNNQTMEARYKRETHAEGTADWNRVIQLADWGAGTENYKNIPYLGMGEPPVELIPGGDIENWPDAEFFASFLAEMEPVIDLVETASKHPTPVRFPIKFQGYATLLPHIQEPRNILRLLSLDCDHAYFNQDTDRTLRDILLMQSTTAAFDSRECLVVELVQVALRMMHYGSIRRTLTHSIWDAAELKKLSDSLSPKNDFADRWTEIVHNELAFFGMSLIDESPEVLRAALQQPISNSRVLPSEQKLMIDLYEEAAQIPIGSPNHWPARAESWEQKAKAIPENSFASAILPAFPSIIMAEIRAEDDRRWTVTAVALQQYKQRHGTWPQRLSDLEKIGLSQNDYSTCEQELFGYEVDGGVAYLWKVDPKDCAAGIHVHISPTRPVPKDDEEREEQIDHLLKLN